MRPPECEICGAGLDPQQDGAGLVQFQPDDQTREWRARAETAGTGFVGHPPDTGWFCAEHFEAALDAARTNSLAEGRRHIEARARHIDVATLTFPEPGGAVEVVAVPPRSSDGFVRVLRELRPLLLSALGQERLLLRSSSSFRLDEVHDRSVSHCTLGPFDLFDRIEYRRVDGALEAFLIESRVVFDGALLGLVRIGPFDQLGVWLGDGRLRGWVDAVLSDLAAPPVDLLDPSPDLVGVDLGGGRLGASDAFELQWVEWDVADLDAGELAQVLRDALPTLFEAVALAPPSKLESSQKRTWHPIDGSQPPYCPFTETFVDEGLGGLDDGVAGVRAVIQMVVEHWNDDDVANATVSLTIDGHVSIGAFGANDGGRSIRHLRLDRPTTAEIVAIVDQLVS